MNSFKEKMPRLVAELNAQFAESAKPERPSETIYRASVFRPHKCKLIG
jgi:hypothetical protein